MTKRGKICLAATALVAGIVVGRIFQSGSAVMSGETEEISRDRLVAEETVSGTDPSRKSRPRRMRDDHISFSRAQWSQLVGNPGLWKISVGSYLAATKQIEERIPIFEDIPLVGRLFDGSILRDLSAQAQFFGWDEAQTRGVRSALTRYGDDLAAVEKKSARVEYPDGGGVRIDFSACQPQREEIAARLRDEITRVLGARDGERFAVLSQMEGLAGDLPTQFEIHAANFLDIIIFTDPDDPETPDQLISPELKPPLTGRFRHLDPPIVWRHALEHPPVSSEK